MKLYEKHIPENVLRYYFYNNVVRVVHTKQECMSIYQFITFWLFMFVLIKPYVKLYTNCFVIMFSNIYRGCRGCEYEPRSWRGVLDTTLCVKVCHWLSTGQWFSLGNPVSSINKTDRHDITEILLKVAFNTINPNPSNIYKDDSCSRLIEEFELQLPTE